MYVISSIGLWSCYGERVASFHGRPELDSMLYAYATRLKSPSQVVVRVLYCNVQAYKWSFVVLYSYIM